MTKWEYRSVFVKILDDDAIRGVNEGISDEEWEIYHLERVRASAGGRVYFKRPIEDGMKKETASYCEGYSQAKHFFFNAQKTLVHWKYVVKDDGPKGREYARLIHKHLHTVLKEDDDD